MFIRRSLLVAALLLSAFHQQSQAQEPAYYDSLRLVSAMREDEVMLLAVRAAKAMRNEPIAEDAKCFDRYEYPELTDIPARQISERMTAGEGRQQRAALPFATSRLALVVQINATNAERTLSVAAGQNRLAMIQHGAHMLTGKAAETILQSLRQKPAELIVTPEGLPGYVIPVRQQDFDFAYAEFSECLADLKSS